MESSIVWWSANGKIPANSKKFNQSQYITFEGERRSVLYWWTSDNLGWKESRNDYTYFTTRHTQISIQVIMENQVLIKKFQYKKHIYRFCLPESSLPCSFESKPVCIRYYFKVTIDIPYASPPQGMKYFTVIGPHIDCMEEQYLVNERLNY